MKDQTARKRSRATTSMRKDAAGNVFHTYSTHGRGDEMLVGAYMYLDLTPKGRNETGPHNQCLSMARWDSYGPRAVGYRECSASRSLVAKLSKPRSSPIPSGSAGSIWPSSMNNELQDSYDSS